MGIGASIKSGFGVVAKSWPVILVLFAVAFIFSLINVGIAGQTPAPAAPLNPQQVSPTTVLTGILFMLVTVFTQSGSIGYSRDQIKTGSAGLPNFLSTGAKYYFRVLVLSIIIAVIIGLFVLLAALIVSFLGQQMQIVATILALLTASIGVYILVLLFLAPYVLIGSDKKIIQSIKESMDLVRRNILKVAGIAITLIALGFCLGLILGVLIAVTSNFIKGMTAQVIFALLSSFINSYLGLLVSASFMSLYLSLASSAPKENA